VAGDLPDYTPADEISDTILEQLDPDVQSLLVDGLKRDTSFKLQHA